MIPQYALERAALAYAASGIPIFPLSPGTKIPRAGSRSFAEATADPAAIRSWFAGGIPWNIGFEPARAGYAVIDVDVKNGEPGAANWAELCREHGIDPETYMVQTPSGGVHLYYRGTLPPSASKLARGIDIRSEGSYVLLPPSRLDGGGEYVVVRATSAKPLSPKIRELLGIKETQRQASILNRDDLDQPQNIERARTKLRQRVAEGDVAIEGQGGDFRTFKLACEVMAVGLSEERALALIAEEWNPHCRPPWAIDGGTPQSPSLDMKVRNAARYMQNDAGATGVEPGADVFRATAAAQEAVEASRGQWNGRRMSDLIRAPAVPFWDRDKMFPRHASGGVGMIFGPSGHHKTNLLIAKLFELWRSDDPPRVAYATGEGDEGLGVRFNAHCILHGVDPADLDELLLVTEIPLVAQQNELESFCDYLENAAAFRPNIVVIDTFATALGGADEDQRAAALLSRRGALGQLARKLKAFVLVVHHTGHQGEHARGSSGNKGNVDAYLRVKANADQNADVVELFADKMKDGRSGHSAYFEIADVGGVPVPQRVSRNLFDLLGGGKKFDGQRVWGALTALGALNPASGVRTNVLAQQLYVAEQAKLDPEDWQRAVEKAARRLDRQADALAGYNDKAAGGGQGGRPLLWFAVQS